MIYPFYDEDQYFEGSGGGGSGGGAGGSGILVWGCTNPNAKNYNPLATVDDGSCILSFNPDNDFITDVTEVIEGEFETINTNNPIEIENTVYVHFSSSPTSAAIYVDDIDTQYICPTTLTYNAKEFLTSKYFKVIRGGIDSVIKYRISAFKKTNTSGISVYPIKVEIWNQILNNWDIQSTDLSNSSLTNIYLQFNTNTDDVIDTDTDGEIIDGELIQDPIVVQIIGDVSSNNIIRYKTSDGTAAFVEDDSDENILVSHFNTSETPWIQFEMFGISQFSYNVTYIIYEPNSTEPIELNNDFNKELLPGVTRIVVIANKLFTAIDPNTPTISVENDNLEYNISSGEGIDVVYSSLFTDSVRYVLGNTQRILEPNGLIKLTNVDFSNGLGQYTLYLQPISKAIGSGSIKRVHINVVSKTYLPGPDITKINYPYNIQGADFKGYNENFKISWQSINTNYIEIYVSKYDREFFVSKGSPSGALTLNVADVLRIAKKTFNSSTDKISFNLFLVPFNIEGDSVVSGKLEKITILFDKGNLRLRRSQVIYDIKTAFEQQFNKTVFDDEISRHLTHYAHFGEGNNKLISTWDVDKETFSIYVENEETSQRTKETEVKSLVLKLYEPLPNIVQPNQQLWISKIQSLPIIDQIIMVDEEVDKCIRLQPNFNLDLGDDIGYQILDDIIASGSVSSAEIIEQYIESNEFSLEKLNIQYLSGSDYNWEAFIKYSSAEERSENFFYKVKLIEFNETTLTNLEAASTATGSLSVKNEMSRITGSISDVKKGFDAFEKLLYTRSGSLSYPGAETPAVSSSTHVDTISWYNTIIDSAQTYDVANKNMLVSNIPQHIIDDPNGQDFILFFNMIGQHFDILWNYINGIASSKKLTHSSTEGLTNELVYHMLESLGWDADMGVKSQYLWEYAFGKRKDGSNASSMTGKERQQEIWRRLLNNLPYLFKHKGTKRALHAAMACYGIPSSMLTIMEFGGPVDPTAGGVTMFTFDDRTAALNFDGDSTIDIPWHAYNSGSLPLTASLKNTYPNSVEMRINTEYKVDQILIQANSWDLKLLTGNTASGSQAALQFNITGSGNNVQSGSTSYFPVYNDEYTQIVLNRTLSGSNYVYDFYGKEGFNERIRNEGSGQVIVPTSSLYWDFGSEIELGTTFSGSMDEFRLWATPLGESRINNHTLLPDAIDGNHISSSTEDLILRLDFEYPKDRNADPLIKNVSINRNYLTYVGGAAYVSASNFEVATAYPYQYTPYERTVTAKVPSTGVGFSNKVRFESHTLENYLNYGSTSNVSSFDNADDSSKLGLFFSPTREINMDILRSLGQFNIDNYIGDPSDDYNIGYGELDALRNYYFQRFNLNIYEYIQLVRYIDQTLFTTLESLVPGRAKVSSGLLIEPHLLERSKIQRTKPTAEELTHETTIEIQDELDQTATNEGKEGTVDTQEDFSIIGTTPFYSGSIDVDTELTLTGTTPFYSGSITIPEETIILTGEINNYTASIDAKIEGTIIGEYYGITFKQYGMDTDSLTVAGFGLWGTNGHTIRTRINKDGHHVQDRVQVYRVKESSTQLIPENIDPNDASLGTNMVSNTFYKYRVTTIPFPSGSTPADAPSVSGNIVEVVPLEGYFPYHYRYVEDLPTGLENSYFNGAKQTSATTLDGGPAVETFVTNPNILRVSDTGRGSGEPVLIVD